MLNELKKTINNHLYFIFNWLLAQKLSFDSLASDPDKYIQKAREILSGLDQPIRLFICPGPGMGNQVYALHVLERMLHDLGLKVDIEVIATNDLLPRPDSKLEVFKDPIYSSMPKVLALFGREKDRAAIQDIETFSLATGQTLRIISAEYFHQNKKSFAPVKYAFFFGTRQYIPETFHGSSYPDIAKANKPIYFSQHTGTNAAAGFTLGEETEYPAANLIPYAWTKAPINITQLIQEFRARKPVHADFVATVLNESNIELACLYGVHKNLHAQQAIPLFHLVTALTAAFKNLSNREAPLVIAVNNDITAENWQSLMELFANPPLESMRQFFQMQQNFTFFDLNTMTRLPDFTQANTTYIVHVGAQLPAKLFKALAQRTRFPLVGEGTGMFDLANNLGKVKFDCESFNRTYVTGLFYQRSDLVGLNVCPDDFNAWRHGVPGELSGKFAEYHNVTEPTIPGDRVSYAIAQADNWQPKNNTPDSLFQAYLSRNLFSFAGRVTLKTTLYSGVEASAVQILKRSFKVNDMFADVASKFLMLAIQCHFEGGSFDFFKIALLVLLFSIKLKFSINNTMMKNVLSIMPGIIFMTLQAVPDMSFTTILDTLLDIDLAQVMLFISFTLLTSATRCATYYSVEKVFDCIEWLSGDTEEEPSSEESIGFDKKNN